MSFVSVALIALVGIVISYLILNYYHRRSSIKTVNTLPGPRAFPLIGNAWYFLRRSSDEFLDITIKLTENYPSPLKLWMANKLLVIIHEADQMQVILQNAVEKNMIYKFIEPAFGKGLLTASELTWIEYRKIIAPNFSTIALRRTFDVFVEQSLMLAHEFEKIGLNRKKIIHNHISKYAMNTACGTLTNIKKPESLSNEIDQCLEVFESVRKTFKSRVRNVFLYPNLIFNLTAVGREQRKSVNCLHSFTNKIIQEHIHTLNAQNTNIEPETSNHKTFLDVLLEMSHKNKYPQEMIHDNLITIMLEAFDTIAVTVDFAIFMLANFPEIQEKAYEELWEIYETETPKCAPIKYEDLQHMNYLDRVIKETMRLFPAVPIIGRYLTKDVKIGEFVLPKGTEIILAILALHRNEKYWPDALIFDPERFLPGKIGTSNKYYMPFGYGPRNCIGMRYAMIAIKVLLAILIRTFVFKVEKSIPINAIKLDMAITLCTVKPIEVIIEKRELIH